MRFPGLVWFLICFVSLGYWEAVVHYTVYSGFTVKFLYAVGLTAAVACLMTLVILLVPRRIRFGTTFLGSAVFAFLYGSQMVYEFIFGTMYSMAQMGMACRQHSFGAAPREGEATRSVRMDIHKARGEDAARVVIHSFAGQIFLRYSADPLPFYVHKAIQQPVFQHDPVTF